MTDEQVSDEPGLEEQVPYRFDPTTTAGAVVADYADLADGEETGVVVTVAGRLMLRRDQGKLAFGDLQDSTGRVQLFALQRSTPNFPTFTWVTGSG